MAIFGNLWQPVNNLSQFVATCDNFLISNFGLSITSIRGMQGVKGCVGGVCRRVQGVQLGCWGCKGMREDAGRCRGMQWGCRL